jgi:hypothetical protein
MFYVAAYAQTSMSLQRRQAMQAQLQLDGPCVWSEFGE